MRNRMTPKQQAFANAIVEGMNPSEAYRAAGYSNRMSAHAVTVEAQRLLKHPVISRAIESGKEEAARKAAWSRETALERLQDVNGIAYGAIKEKGRIQRDTANAFFGSLDRLNDMTDVSNAKQEAPRIVIDIPIRKMEENEE